MPKTTAADVIIIGAGIAGIATAHYLTRKESTREDESFMTALTLSDDRGVL